jgi:hypothetical protein
MYIIFTYISPENLNTSKKEYKKREKQRKIKVMWDNTVWPDEQTLIEE